MIDHSVIKRAAEETDTVILMFSGGKDSIACLDLCCAHFKTVIPVHLYFVKGLKYKEKHMAHYAKRYGVDIAQFPRCEDLSRQMCSGSYQSKKKKVPKIRQYEMDLFLRRRLNIPWIVYGYKRADSLQRRGIMNANCLDGEQYMGGVDMRNRKIYPLANWSEKEVFKYLKMKRLPLPPDYAAGFRDINTFKGRALLWLYHNHPEDYETVKKQYPFIEAALIRAREG